MLAPLRKPLLAVGLATFSQLSAQVSWDNRPGLLSSNSTPAHSTYAGGRFLIFSSGVTYWHSAAGTAAYSSGFFQGAPSFYTTTGAATGNGRVIVSGSSNTLYTTTEAAVAGLPATPVAWEKRNPLTERGADLFRVRFLNNRFIVGTARFIGAGDFNTTSYSEVLTSSDGESWTSHKFIANTTGNAIYNIRDAAFKPGVSPGTGTWVFGTPENAVITANEDLTAATRVAIPNIGTGPSLLHTADLFVLGTSNGKILTSPSGATGTWTERTLPVAMSVIGNLFTDGATIVAVGSRTPSNTSAILTSTDGITWTSPATQPALANSILTTALKADGLWLAAGNGRTIQTSGSSSVSPPAFDTPPANASASTSGTAIFTVAVSGSPAPQIKWQRNSIDLSDGPLASGAVVVGATTATLTLTGLTFAEAGTFTAVATNSVSAVNSIPATLSVNAHSRRQSPRRRHLAEQRLHFHRRFRPPLPAQHLRQPRQLHPARRHQSLGHQDPPRALLRQRAARSL
jgi:hypothetical protein